MAAPKIIVLGSLNGNLEPAFKKLAALHAKNSFALALLTGDVFGPETDDDDQNRSAAIDALLAGTLTVPLPTYFTVGSRPLPAPIVARIEAAAAAGGEDICPNLHFLGRRSVTKTSDGLRIASLGGALATDGAGGKEQHLPFHTDEDARSLKGAHGADILLTSTWPAGVWGGGSKVPLDRAHREHVAASRSVAELCAALRPRYHLTASPGPFFYEREPFIQAADETNPDVVSVTRFISMAPFANAAKQKALYAFALNKSDDVAPPPGATASPLLPRDRKRHRGDDDDDNNASSYSRFGHHNHQDGHHKRRRPAPGPDQCFFCLSNPRTATHMIGSIGEDAYVTTAKGPLPPADGGPPLRFPGHLIIIPLAHAPTVPDARTRREMARFRASIQAAVSARSRRALGVVAWEVSRARNVHLIWQLVAVPAALVADGLAEAALRVEADRAGYPAFARKEEEEEEAEAGGGAPGGARDGGGDFVRVWLWSDGEDEVLRGTTLVMRLEPEARFDLQFVRRALAKLLGLEARAVWQECQQTEEEETKDTEAFRDMFKEWDFTLG